MLLLQLLLLVLTTAAVDATKGHRRQPSAPTGASPKPPPPSPTNGAAKPAKRRPLDSSAETEENGAAPVAPVADAPRGKANGAEALSAAATSVAASAAPPQVAASTATPAASGSVEATGADKGGKTPLAGDGGSSASKEEWADADDEQEIQPPASLGSPPPHGPPGGMARPRPLSAPFVRHYSKHMAILWEWYTKTIGATMNGKRKRDEDVGSSLFSTGEDSLVVINAFWSTYAFP